MNRLYKTFDNIASLKSVLVFLLAVIIAGGHAMVQGADVKETVINGVVKDAQTKKPIDNASVVLSGTNISTVTNADGYFSLKVPPEIPGNNIEVSQFGYITRQLTTSELEGKKKVANIMMTPKGVILDELKVYPVNPRNLVKEALEKIDENYPDHHSLVSAFYRETVQKGRRYISISEAIIDVYKTAYKNRITLNDKVQLKKGRRLLSQKASDTIAVKIVGGPTMPIVLDLAKNEDLLFNIEETRFYDFTMESPVEYDGRLQYVVKFKPVVKQDYAMCEGLLYIDRETKAISKAEFQLDMTDKALATKTILFKKPNGLRFTPQEMSFVVTYRYQDGKSYLNYISSKTRFKCDWKRKLFSSGYTAFTEAVMVDRDDFPTEKIAKNNTFGKRDVFYDLVEDYWDADFWNDYNIIEPTESLEKAVKKLRKN